MHLARDPERVEDRLAGPTVLTYFKRHQAAVICGAVGVFEGRRTLPDRTEHREREESTAAVLPRRHGTPDATIMEHGLVVPPAWRDVERRLVILASEIVA